MRLFRDGVSLSDTLPTCAVHVCENPTPYGEGSVCDPCEVMAYNHGAIHCPTCGVHVCDSCGIRPAWAIVGGEGSPLWSCEDCMDEVLQIPVPERDFQAAHGEPCLQCEPCDHHANTDPMRCALCGHEDNGGEDE